MFIYLNPNPSGKHVGDCVVRALSIAFDDSWENIYADLTMVGRFLYDMPNRDYVWGEYLKMNGFTRHSLPDTCPQCYTIKMFCKDHPDGVYVVATGSHVVVVINGDYYDTADSGNEVPIYYFSEDR